MAVTTTSNLFRVEDVTFKGARTQNQVLKDLEEKYGSDSDAVSGSVSVPNSLTPEQVKTFYSSKIEGTNNPQEKKLYTQTIRWIDELLETKKKLVALELKYKENSEEDESDDI